MWITGPVVLGGSSRKHTISSIAGSMIDGLECQRLWLSGLFEYK